MGCVAPGSWWWRAPVLHAVVSAAGGVMGFAGLTLAFKAWIGGGFVPGWPVLLGLGGIAFLGAVGGLAGRPPPDAPPHLSPIVLSTLSALAAQGEHGDETRDVLGRMARLLQYRQQAQGGGPGASGRRD
jgi:hypothetical protein